MIEANTHYAGAERRHIPYKMQVEPSSGWWSKVTMPFILALLIQGGGVVWWASTLNSEMKAVRDQIEHLDNHAEGIQDYNLERHRSLVSLISDVRREISDNRRMMVDHLNTKVVE